MNIQLFTPGCPVLSKLAVLLSFVLAEISLHANPAALKWSVQLKGWPGGPSVGLDRCIYVTTGSSSPKERKLVCVKDYETNGVMDNIFVPELTSTFGSFAPTVGRDGAVYTGTKKGSGMKGIFILSPDLNQNRFYPLSVANGGVINSFALNEAGTLFNASGDGQLVQLDANGAITTLDRSSNVDSVSPVIGFNGQIFYAPTLPTFAQVDPASGNRIHTWTSQRGNFVASPAIGPNGIVYVCARNAMYALDPFSGEKREFFTPEMARTVASAWEFGTCTPAIDSHGVLYVGNLNGWFYAVDISSGRLLAQFQTGAIAAAPAVAGDDTVYVGSKGGFFWALRLEQGQLVEKGRAGGFGEFRDALAIGDQGTVYITDQDGYLYAFEGTTAPQPHLWSMFQHNARRDGLGRFVPIIANISSHQTCWLGKSLSLEVAALGVPPLAYEWSFNGQPIPSGTNSMLPLPSLSAANVGSYSVKVTSLASGNSAESTGPIMVSALKLRRTGGVTTLQVTGLPGNRYQLQYTDSLAATVDWTPWQAIVLNQNAEEFADSAAGDTAYRYYRAIYQSE